MRKLVRISDLTIRWEWTDSPFILWSELKDVFDFYDYLELVRFVAAKKIHCAREWLDVNIVIEFLGQRN